MDKLKGFSLIELMVVLTIFSILSSLALPTFENIIRRQEVMGEANRLFSLLYFARSEAIKRNQVVTICKSNNADTCGGTWSDGWIVFQDNNSDGSRGIGETLIIADELRAGYNLKWTAFGSNNYIRFRKSGIISAQNGTFTLCPSDLDIRLARAVVISKTARVRHTKDSDGDGIYENAAGESLICN